MLVHAKVVALAKKVLDFCEVQIVAGDDDWWLGVEFGVQADEQQVQNCQFGVGFQVERSDELVVVVKA